MRGCRRRIAAGRRSSKHHTRTSPKESLHKQQGEVIVSAAAKRPAKPQVRCRSPRHQEALAVVKVQGLHLAPMASQHCLWVRHVARHAL